MFRIGTTCDVQVDCGARICCDWTQERGCGKVAMKVESERTCMLPGRRDRRANIDGEYSMKSWSESKRQDKTRMRKTRLTSIVFAQGRDRKSLPSSFVVHVVIRVVIKPVINSSTHHRITIRHTMLFHRASNRGFRYLLWPPV
jgi:hypothetical protein